MILAVFASDSRQLLATQVVVDQSSFPVDGNFAVGISNILPVPNLYGQSFKVGVSGKLASVELLLASYVQPQNGTLTATIYSTQSGVPTTSLGSVTILGSEFIPGVIGLHAFDYSQADVTVVAGEQLAVVLSTNSHNGFVFFGGGNTYANGTPVFKQSGKSWQVDPNFATSQDYGFRTSVLIPEPTSFALLAVGVLLLALKQGSKARQRAARPRNLPGQ